MEQRQWKKERSNELINHNVDTLERVLEREKDAGLKGENNYTTIKNALNASA